MASQSPEPLPQEFRLLVTTWNMGNAAPDNVDFLVAPARGDKEISVLVFGAQEATYGRGSPAVFSQLDAALGAEWVRVQLSTLGQMKLGIYVRKWLRPHVVDVVSAVERCGFGDVVSNKGGIAIRLTILHSTFVFISSHLEAHEGFDHRAERNKDVSEILKGTLHFKTTHYDPTNVPEHLFFMGDLNYRMVFDFARENDADQPPAAQQWEYFKNLLDGHKWEALAKHDELLHDRAAGRVFCGFEEAPPMFPPTFKVERKPGFQYSQQRLPAWCDRVLWRSLPPARFHVHALWYKALPEAITSDHKPVQALFNVRVPIPPALSEPPLALRQAVTDAVYIQFFSLRLSGMPKMDSMSENDCYVKFRAKHLFHASVSMSTKAKLNTAEPAWGEHELPILYTRFASPAALHGASLMLVAMDQDIARDDIIGIAYLPLDQVLEYQRSQTAPPYTPFTFRLALTHAGLHVGQAEGCVSIMTQTASI
eukprot:m.29695 g.29695  ORF g.29695 m.29695 type:complete len:480 (-) comp9186_c0_seq2:22-1461(-)